MPQRRSGALTMRGEVRPSLDRRISLLTGKQHLINPRKAPLNDEIPIILNPHSPDEAAILTALDAIVG
jgi:hypothetical protein